MKPILLSFFFTLLEICCLGQNLVHIKDKPYDLPPKALIDSSSYNRWPTTEYPELSDNGKYISYFVGNEIMGCHKLVLQTSSGKWKKELYGIQNAIFTQDSKRAILSTSNKIYIVKLGVGVTDSISDVVSFKLPKKGNGEWIAYYQGLKDRKLILRNLESNKSSIFESVKDYYFNGNGLILIREDKKSTKNEQHLDWIDISNNKISNVWNGNGIQNIIFSSEGNRLAFIASNQNSLKDKKRIWYYDLGTKEAYLILSDLRTINDSSLELGSLQYFTTDNSRIFVTLKERSYFKKDTVKDTSLPEVWSFNDEILQSQQKKETGQKENSYKAIVNILEGTMLRIEEKNEFSSFSYQPPLTDFIVVSHQENSAINGETVWNSSCHTTSYLVSTKTGKRISLNSIADEFSPNMSRSEKFFIYNDKGSKNFFTYEIASGVTRNITKNITTSWNRRFTNPIAGWLDNDSAVVMYDRNDIWLVDPKGVFSPVNLTNGYGKKKNIQLFLTIANNEDISFVKNRKVFLTAFNPNTKENGFYFFKFGQAADPVLLTMGSVLYYIPGNGASPDGVNFKPVKAKNTNSYIVRRMSNSEYPNLFYTTNFQNFTPLTDFHPQKSYNWYSTELHKWKSLDSTFLQGILYKPDNFDSTKKYPVIFNYYESMSDGLNAFLMPSALDNGCVINIPYYVSNGYLVFCPDIEYRTGDPMQGTYNAVVSAAEHISHLPFVDAQKMGIQGCSWGGIQTNYLVTHTNLFAAACSASGMADWISGFNSLFDNGSSMQSIFEAGQVRVGGNLWDSLRTYIKSSPILKANNISTPFLIMHTKDDGVCPLSNAIEFFTALRRLGKKSWMLVYEGDHGIWGSEGKDFSIRMAQFFDHYLKNSPAPFWMTKGVPAKLKGIDTGLNLDYTTKTPTPKLINETSDNTAKNKSQ